MTKGFPRLVHKLVYHLVRFFIRPMVWRKYRFTTDHVPKMKEPFLLVSNHTTEDDMLFTGLASFQQTYFVCGEHLLRNKVYGKALRILQDPIPLTKGGASLSAVKEMLLRLKAGCNICLFPEGKRSFHGETIPAPLSLGKLVKKAGCALVTYRIRGGYFTYPRWARNHLRNGKVEGKVMGVYSSAQLKEMTAQEITDLINRDTYENAYQVQRDKRWRYVGKDKAKGMEKLLFICPACHQFDTIQTEGDSFFCSCGLKGVYNDYGFLEGENLPFDNVYDWIRWIEKEFDDYVGRNSQTDAPLFVEDNVLLYQMMDGYKNQDILTAPLKIYPDKLVIGTAAEDGKYFEFPMKEVSALSLLFGNILLFTYNGIYYGMTGETFRAWKCARLWHLMKGDTNDKTKEI